MVRTLREWRLARQLTIEELAAAARVSNKTITQIEHGRLVPKMVSRRKLTAALGVRPEEIVFPDQVGAPSYAAAEYQDGCA